MIETLFWNVLPLLLLVPYVLVCALLVSLIRYLNRH